MNERIFKLAEQAGFENGHQDQNGRSLSSELEKFAELVVQECAQVGEDTDGNWNVRYNILKHFGLNNENSI